MLRVTVEMVPFGVEVSKRTLYVMEIANIGRAYKAKVAEDAYDYDVVLRESDAVTLAKVNNFSRSRMALALVAEAIKALGKWKKG